MRRNLIWDMGGTLVDTYPALDATLVEVVERHGGAVDPASVAALTRRSTGHAIEELAGRFGIATSEFRAAEASLKEHWRTAPPPVVDGAREAMATARDLGGLNVIVTHRDAASARDLVAGLGLDVDDLLCAPAGYPRKPAPDMYLEVLSRHDLTADSCLAVGDRPIDAEAAAGAGIDSAMLVTAGLDLDAGPARWTVTSLRQVPGLLG
jgi:HAD superfamily hydrolase (TIGR01509 family)